jgi:hypothetical protein
VHVDVAADAGDTELVDIHLPEGVDVTPLESLERDRLLDSTDHEPVALQHPVDGGPAHPDAPTTEDRVDAERSPGWMAAPQLEDAIDQVPVDPVGTTMGTPGVGSKSLDAFLSVISAPITERPLRDAEEPADLGAPDSFLEVLLDGAQS